MKIAKIGQKFGRWTIIGTVTPNFLFRKWLCKCKCGKERMVQENNLKSGKSQSCGCLNREITANLCRERSKTHGMTNSPEYKNWRELKRRCRVKHRKEYKNYGERGVTVCPRWKNSFENFFMDMGKRPFPDATIDRIDNKKGYSKENCRWATRYEQSQNKRKKMAL